MSEYADICIKNLSLFSFRNYLNSDIVSLIFSKKDLAITQNYISDLEEEDSEEYTRYIYKTTIKNAKERLDAQGFSISNFEKIFNKNLLQAVDYSGFLYNLGIDIEDRDEIALERCKKRVTFRKWQNAMKKIVSYELEHGNIRWRSTTFPLDVRTECEKIIYYSLKDTDSESFYGIFTEFVDIAFIFRLILCRNDVVYISYASMGRPFFYKA